MVMFLLKCMILEHSSEAQHRPARCRRISISIFMFEYYVPMDFYVINVVARVSKVRALNPSGATRAHGAS